MVTSLSPYPLPLFLLPPLSFLPFLPLSPALFLPQSRIPALPHSISLPPALQLPPRLIHTTPLYPSLEYTLTPSLCPDWPEEETEAAGGGGTTKHLWEESWDDDDTIDDFSAQLRCVWGLFFLSFFFLNKKNKSLFPGWLLALSSDAAILTEMAQGRDQEGGGVQEEMREHGGVEMDTVLGFAVGTASGEGR